MEILLFLVFSAFNLWVIFGGGAERLQNTLFAYLEFGFFADNPQYIRAMAWFSLISAGISLVISVSH